MSLILDSSGLYSFMDADDKHHSDVVRAVQGEKGELILPVAILSELDYLVRVYLGVGAELALLEDILEGAFILEPLTTADLDRARELIEQYRSLDIGLADATIAATAERLGIYRILTLDERDFRAMRPKGASHFTLLPSDMKPKKR